MQIATLGASREATPLSPYEPRFGGAFLWPAQAAQEPAERDPVFLSPAFEARAGPKPERPANGPEHA